MKYQIVHQNHEIERKINAIKGVRSISGLGLKEAKIIVDDIYQTTKTVSVDGHPHDHFEVVDGVRLLSEAGFSVRELDENTPIRLHLEDAARAAMNMNRHETARDILNLIIKIG